MTCIMAAMLIAGCKSRRRSVPGGRRKGQVLRTKSAAPGQNGRASWRRPLTTIKSLPKQLVWLSSKLTASSSTLSECPDHCIDCDFRDVRLSIQCALCDDYALSNAHASWLAPKADSCVLCMHSCTDEVADCTGRVMH